VRAGGRFEVVSEYAPAGDQPAAIEELERRVAERTAELRVQVQERERGEALQAALYAIAELSSSERDMSDMLRRIHDVVRRLMYAENFFIVLRNSERHTLRFIYFADVKDPGLVNPAVEIPEEEMDSSRTVALLRHGLPLRGSGRELASRLGAPTALLHTFEPWLPAPLVAALRSNLGQGKDRVLSRALARRP